MVFFLLLLKSIVILSKAESVSLAIKEVLNLHIILIKPVMMFACGVADDYFDTCFVDGEFKCIPLLVNIESAEG